jgi:hypothetical protein
MKKKKSKEDLHNYYELKPNAVNDLVDAIKNENSDINLQDEKSKTIPNPYKTDRLSNIPTWIKALFIKYWFAGMICYFGFWGLGVYFSSTLDLVVFVGFLTGMVTDLLINSAFLYFESDKKEYHKYIMLPVSSKRLWTLLVNVIYGIVVTLLVSGIYALINLIQVKVKDLPEGTISLGVEPLLYGLIFLIVDMFFISIKNLIVKIANKK